jgi:hypothetical protein
MPKLSSTELNLGDSVYAEFKARLASCPWFFSQGTALFVLARGSHAKVTVTALAQNPEIDLVWHGSWIRWWAFPMRLIAASYGGIVRVSGPEGFRRAVESLLNQAYVEFLLVDEKAAAGVANRLRSDGVRASAEALAKEGCEEILGTVSVYDDAMDDYPVTHYFREGRKNPLVAEYE